MSAIIQPTRRRFIAAALAFVAAPMIVRATSIMPVRALPIELLDPLENWTRGPLLFIAKHSAEFNTWTIDRVPS